MADKSVQSCSLPPSEPHGTHRLRMYGDRLTLKAVVYPTAVSRLPWLPWMLALPCVLTAFASAVPRGDPPARTAELSAAERSGQVQGEQVQER